MVANEGSGTKEVEVELKLEFDPGDAPRLLAHPILAGHPAPETRELISTYYDTDDDVLRKAGVFLRIRADGEGYTQTIKATRDVAEFFERREWEHPLSTHEPDLEAVEATALAPLLTPEVRARVQPRFHTRFRRKLYRLRHEGADIELAVDQGEINAGLRTALISELELELKSGEKHALFALAGELAETVALHLAVKSKAERGFELLDDRGHGVEKSLPVEIAPDMTCAEAFRAVGRNCVRQIVANEPALRDGRPEGLHQMRVGLRRLRAGLWLFAEVVAGPEADRIKGELKWIAQELGPARDLDVFAADVLEPLRKAHPDDPELAASHRDFTERRTAAYARAVAAVDSARFRKLLLDLTAWIESGAWTAGEAACASVSSYAVEALAPLRRKIKKSGRDLRELPAGKRHRLRIRAKRLRYATEFFAATFPGKKSAGRRRKSLAALQDLQDALGTLNDIAVRKALLAAGEEDADAATRHPALAAEHDEEELLDEAERAYARFAKVKAFWKD